MLSSRALGARRSFRERISRRSGSTRSSWDKLAADSSRPARPSRLSSAGAVLQVGLICFGLWLFLDARQLYQSALVSPIGVRRSVAMTIMRPISRVEDALSLDRIVNVADRAIGKDGTPGGSAIATPSAPPAVPHSSHPRSGIVGQGGKPGKAGKTTPTGPKLATIVQPSVVHPLTILDVGDSIGEDLGIGLANVLGTTPGVHFIAGSVGDTGLANLGYYNWLAELPKQLAKYHPQVVVIMLGGNDAQSFQNGPAVVSFGTAQWQRVYSARVAQMISEATSTGAHVIWVGLPIMGPTSGLSNTAMQQENVVFAAQANSHPGASYISTWKLFENASGQYATYLPGPGGGIVQVRDPDEVHIDPPGGTDLLGADVVRTMQMLWHIKL